MEERNALASINRLHLELFGKPIDAATWSWFRRNPAAVTATLRHLLVSARCRCRPAPARVEHVGQFNREQSSAPSASLSDKRILVVGLVKRWSARQFGNAKQTFADLKQHCLDCRLYFLTNNNDDHGCTEGLLRAWISDAPDDVDGCFHADVHVTNRTSVMARLRNTVYRRALERFGERFDYVMVLDLDLSEPIPASRIQTCFLPQGTNWDMVCGNAVHAKSRYHYDNFALRFLDDPDDIREMYPGFERHYGKTWEWNDRLFVFDSWTRVRSAFGGACIIRKSSLDATDDGTNGRGWWDESVPPHECEHLSLCRAFDRVYVNPHLTWAVDTRIEGVLYDPPCVFVPRDAGFFSVFNFFIGMLTTGRRAYPYWNIKDILQLDGGKVQHFCYMDQTADNSWFTYFQPVRFFEGDDTHAIAHQLISTRSRGETAPEEFRLPHKLTELLQSPDFKAWRCRVHAVFRQHVDVIPSIHARVDDICRSFRASSPSAKVIGVHYRHPSHCCEQGNILLADYFAKVDDILERYPDASIFLATDTDFGVAAFQMQYAGRVTYNKHVTRASMDNLLRWAYAAAATAPDAVGLIDGTGYEVHIETSARKEFGPALGRDVLTDVLSLCRCDWLVHATSNISLAASYMNPELEMVMVR